MILFRHDFFSDLLRNFVHHARSFRFDFFAGFVRSHQIARASLINAFNTSPLARLGVRFA
jgi:hypothetical protein